MNCRVGVFFILMLMQGKSEREGGREGAVIKSPSLPPSLPLCVCPQSAGCRRPAHTLSTSLPERFFLEDE